MTEACYLKDAYIKEFDCVVESVDKRFVVLDKTIFYPQGGGQPCDYGILKKTKDEEEYRVVFVKKASNNISHEVDKDGLRPGDKVHGIIDWERRYKLMRYHTASHIIASIINKESGALITGNQLDTEKSRIDFNLDDYDRESLDYYIKKCNDAISRNLDVKTYFLPREKAMEIPGIVKLARALPPEISELRIVEIGNIDVQADGGTHVRNTKEIGEIEVLKIENKGKNNRRIYFRLKDV